jgi:hypothetical protein
LIPDVPGTYMITLNVSDAFAVGTPDSVEVTAATASSYAEQNTMLANQVNSALTATQVSTAGNQEAFGNFLTQAVKATQAGNTQNAVDKLNQAIARTDGCERNGVPDSSGPGRDWITDCSAQAQMLVYLRAALRGLTQ